MQIILNVMQHRPVELPAGQCVKTASFSQFLKFSSS